jgi:DNA-binding GntR family transcriptional regulator
MASVYDQLRDDVVSGHLPPGTQLIETALADRYGTSRTPVREALRRLQQDGLVDRGDRGLQVPDRSADELLEIYDVRIDLEGLAAAQAAKRRTPLDLTRIAHCVGAMEAVDLTDTARMSRTNRAFHDAVWRASHNATLVILLERLQSQLSHFAATTFNSPGRWATVLADSQALAALIEAQDASGARQLAESHTMASRDLRLSIYLNDRSYRS